MIKIIVDENIVFANEAFGLLGGVRLLSGRKINNDILKDADVLIVRSITKVDETLLKNTPIKFVGTATIGNDHIDLEYLKNNNIVFADAKGCNAYSVAEYLVAALLRIVVHYRFSLREKSIGVVGVGNIGSKVAKFAEALGMKVLLNDPPLKRKGDRQEYVELDKMLSADIITLHVPLNLNGIDKTYHLFDKEKLKKLKDGAVLINTSRGAVVNNEDLLDVIDQKKLKVVLDVWENEPEVNIDLLNKVVIGTPHIAGYSLEGKINGTEIIFKALCNYLNTKINFDFRKKPPPNSILNFDKSDSFEESLEKIISKVYSIDHDNKKMREVNKLNVNERGKYFDLLRKNYPVRREFNNYTIKIGNVNSNEAKVLKDLRYNIPGV